MKKQVTNNTEVAVNTIARPFILATAVVTAEQGYHTVKPSLDKKKFHFGLVAETPKGEDEEENSTGKFGYFEANQQATSSMTPVFDALGNKHYHAEISKASSKSCIFRDTISSFIALNTAREQARKLDLRREILPLTKGISKTKESNKDKAKAAKEAGEKAESTNFNLTSRSLLRTKDFASSLFGDFNNQLEARLLVGKMLSQEPVELAYNTGTRRVKGDKYEQYLSDDDKALLDSLKNIQARRAVLDQQIADKKRELRALTASDSKEIDDAKKEIKSLEKAKKDLDKEADGYKVALDTLWSFAYVPAGTKFDWSFQVHDLADTRNLSAVVYALGEFAKYPKLGGHQDECGLVSMKIDFEVVDNGQRAKVFSLAIAGDYTFDFDRDVKVLDQKLYDQYVTPALVDNSWHVLPA